MTQQTINNNSELPFISIVLPCYNEEAILENNLDIIIAYMEGKNHEYLWEIVLIDDGSKDRTGIIADKYENDNENIRVIHHPTNLNLGNA